MELKEAILLPLGTTTIILFFCASKKVLLKASIIKILKFKSSKGRHNIFMLFSFEELMIFSMESNISDVKPLPSLSKAL